jgi:hypothetical protein
MICWFSCMGPRSLLAKTMSSLFFYISILFWFSFSFFKGGWRLSLSSDSIISNDGKFYGRSSSVHVACIKMRKWLSCKLRWIRVTFPTIFSAVSGWQLAPKNGGSLAFIPLPRSSRYPPVIVVQQMKRQPTGIVLRTILPYDSLVRIKSIVYRHWHYLIFFRLFIIQCVHASAMLMDGHEFVTRDVHHSHSFLLTFYVSLTWLLGWALYLFDAWREKDRSHLFLSCSID